MLIFVEFISNNNESGKICYDVCESDPPLGILKDLIPKWLAEDNIDFKSYKVTQILEGLMQNN